MNRFLLTLGFVGAIACAGIAYAEVDHAHMAVKAPSNASASTKAYVEANSVMHKDMAIAYTGDADRDFVQGMIPHHQGAVDMAKIELQYGKDPEIRKFAQDVINAQTTEITFMKAWLEKNKK
ncbi:MAG: DUF305 domain-containing protein [Alphaproteobacteria bacterium]|nr:DUF305 domain-containing protein [Alphaproteobacteria bacterium]